MDATILGDGRELWTVGFDTTIKSYVDDFCLSPMDHKVEEKNGLVVMPCHEAYNGKWFVFKEGSSPFYSLSTVKDHDLVVTSVESEKMDNACAAYGAHAIASSSWGTGETGPKSGINGHDETAWIAGKNVTEA
jgi:hypothetical protein